MTVQIGTVDGLANISEETIQCFVNAIDFFSQGGVEFAKKNGVPLGTAFQRLVKPVYDKKQTNFNLNDINTPVFTAKGKEQSPACMTYCKKMGLLYLDEGKGIFQLTPLSKEIYNKNISVKEYSFILLTKQGIFKDKNFVCNLFAFISEWFDENPTISEKELGDAVKMKYSDSSLEKTRCDIIVNALKLCGLVSNVVKDGPFALSNLQYAEIFRNFKDNSSFLTPSLRDDEIGYVDYIGSLENGVFNILSSQNEQIYLSKFPNLKRYMKDYTDLIFPLQQIFYGAPGTGKSHSIEEKTKGKRKIRTTFHPDSDYSTFVGCYKPYKANGNAPITYEFVPQAFVKAYVEAWKNYTKKEDLPEESISKEVYLVIEEINRGNCAQIFGDLFQLLDRDGNGFSKYMIDADYDLQRYLQKEFYGDTFDDQFADIKSGEKLCLPNNLHIWATMNTSDQSLFPMDSAFKRRWEWEYVPVNHEDAQRFHIFIGGKSYNWNDFIVTVNKKVFDATQSADKQLGNRFCKSNGVINSGESVEKKQEYMIFSDQFVSKVMFYLWEEVCKDAPEDEQINFMRIKKNLSSTSSVYFTFQELYENKPYEGGLLNREAILQMFMNYLGVAEESSANFKSILAGKSIVDIEETATGIRPKECNLKDLFGEKTTSESEMTSAEEDVYAGSENNDE